MKLASLVSGGKDSLYATFLAKQDNHSIDYVIGFISENKESYMFHIPNVHLVKNIAKLMNVEYIEVHTKGRKEEELIDIENALKSLDIDGVVCGAVASKYQRDRVKKICDKLKLKLVAPLWQRNNSQLLKDMLKDKFKIMITAVAAGDAFDDKWLGKIIDNVTVKYLEKLQKKHGISPLGEGGELETLVINCPLYNKKLDVATGNKHWDSDTQSGWVEIKVVE